MNIFEKLSMFLEYEFVRYALIVGVLIALCAALLGVILVLKRFSFIGDGLSHLSFGVIAVAAVMQLTNELLLVLPVTIICAILLLKSGQKKKTTGDGALAMLSVSSLAIGYLLYNMFPNSPNISGDVCSTLFGSQSILTLTSSDLIVSIVLTIVVLAFFVVFYNKIFAITFDEDFSQATGIKANIYNLIVAIVIAVVVVLAMNLVGSLLISALIIFPALSAMRIFKSFKSVTICSAIFSVVCVVIGILIAIVSGFPVGPMIVAVDLIGYLIFVIVGKVMR